MHTMCKTLAEAQPEKIIFTEENYQSGGKLGVIIIAYLNKGSWIVSNPDHAPRFSLL